MFTLKELHQERQFERMGNDLCIDGYYFPPNEIQIASFLVDTVLHDEETGEDVFTRECCN